MLLRMKLGLLRQAGPNELELPPALPTKQDAALVDDCIAWILASEESLTQERNQRDQACNSI